MQTLKEGWSDASHKRPRTEPFTFALVGSDASREVAVSGEMVWKQSPILWDMLRLSEDKKLSVELSSTDLYYVISFWYDGFLALEESNVVAIAHFCDKYDVNSLEKPLIKSLTSHVFGSKPLSFFKDLYDKCRQIPRLRRAILQKLVKDLSVKEASEEYAFTTASEDAWILFQSQDDCTHKLLEYMTYFHIWVKRKEDPSGLSCCVEGVMECVRIGADSKKTLQAKVNWWKTCCSMWRDLSYLVVSGNEKCMMSTLLDAAASRIL